MFALCLLVWWCSTVDEMDVNFLVPRLRDFAFSVDIR